MQFALLLVQSGLLVMAYCSDVARQDTYQDVVNLFCGKIGLYICRLFIAVHNTGACITFLVIIGDQLDQGKLYSKLAA